MSKKGIVVGVFAVMIAAGAGYFAARKQMAGSSSAQIASAQSMRLR
jgi:hypothetical protein